MEWFRWLTGLADWLAGWLSKGKVKKERRKNQQNLISAENRNE